MVIHNSKNVPTPSTSPPSLVNSTSLSNESSSPPIPSTPPFRGRTRYGDVGHGHVPLHRRGTSNRYENFEDLLREAGYKETRIFTPQADRVGEEAPQSSKSSLSGGVSAMVGFISNLVPGPGSTTRNSSQVPNNSIPSPSIRPRSPSYHSSHSRSNSSIIASSTSSDPTPHVTPQRKHIIQMVNAHSTPQPGGTRSRRAFDSAAPPKSAAPLTRHQSQFGNMPPSRASAYLRHIASVPAMHHSSNDRRRHEDRLDYPSTRNLYSATHPQPEASESSHPSLPKSWLENVARTVLFGSGTTHGDNTNFEWRRERDRSPFSAHSMHVPPSRRPLHNIRPSQTTIPPSGPPNLLARVASSKSRRSEGVVSRARVVCKSAPVSRNGSKVRPSHEENRPINASKIRKHNQERPRGRPARRGETLVPSLARTKVEGDEWLQQHTADVPTTANSNTPWLTSPVPETALLSASPSCTSSDEEDEELDLARILISPRRQNSIRSLRQHLGSSGERPLPLLSLGNRAASNIRTGVPSDSRNDTERELLLPPATHDDAEQEQQDYFSTWTGSGNLRRPITKRKGIPSTWSRTGSTG